MAFNIISSIFFYFKGYNLLKNQIQKMVEQLKENNDNINITDKKIEIFNKKPKKKKRKKAKKNKRKSIEFKNKLKIKNENINAPPRRRSKKFQTVTHIDIKIKNIKHPNNMESKTTLNKNSNKKFDLLNPDIILKEQNQIKEKIIINNFNVMNNYNDTELNQLDYKTALEIDKRTYFQYYWSLIKKKQLIIFSFYPTNDYNSMIIKICLTLFSFILYYTVNGLFFNDKTMHKIYEDEGSFNFFYHIPQMLYSTIICSVINTLLKQFSLSEKDILKLKKERTFDELEKKLPNVLKCLVIKFILFFILSFLFLLLFWYYLACFCAVYKNTQYYLIKDTLISFSFSLLYPFGLNLIPGLFRIPSLKKNDKKSMYIISQYLQLFL